MLDIGRESARDTFRYCEGDWRSGRRFSGKCNSAENFSDIPAICTKNAIQTDGIFYYEIFNCIVTDPALLCGKDIFR